MLKNTRTRLNLMSLERRDVPAAFTMIENIGYTPAEFESGIELVKYPLGMKTDKYSDVETLDNGDYHQVDFPLELPENKSASRPAERGDGFNLRKLIPEKDRMDRFGDVWNAAAIGAETV